jgi:hypothetical protein
MPIKKWAIQYITAFPLIFAILASVQYLKGSSIEQSLEFSLLWSAISMTIFASRRAYMYQKNIACAVCNDLPKKK